MRCRECERPKSALNVSCRCKIISCGAVAISSMVGVYGEAGEKAGGDTEIRARGDTEILARDAGNRPLFVRETILTISASTIRNKTSGGPRGWLVYVPDFTSEELYSTDAARY